MPMRSRVRRFSWILASAFAFAFGLLPKSAFAQGNCGQQLVYCFDRAAQLRTSTQRSVAGIQCEIDYVACTLRSIRF